MGSSGGPNKRGDKKGEFRRLRIDDLLNHDTPAGPSRPPRTSGAGPSSAGGRNRIKCPYCPKLFGSREELKRHRQVEHPTAFVCEQCNTSFFDRGNLNKHIRSVHEKRRPFQCEHCNAAFAFSDGLRRHVRMVHLNDRPYPCPYCAQAFKQRAHLLKHISARHPNNSGSSSAAPGRR